MVCGRMQASILPQTFSSFSRYSGCPIHIPFFTDFLFQPLRLHFATGARGLRRQGKYEIKIIIGGDAVEPLEIAAVTAVDDHIFSIRTLKMGDRLHRAAAVAHPVSRLAIIDVPRVETVGTMVPVMAATGRWTDEVVTVPALEYLLRLFVPRLMTLA